MDSKSTDFPLTNIHEALNDSKIERYPEGKMETFTYKAPRETKESAEAICKSNGTTLSGYVRNCLKALVKDYNPTTPRE